MKNSIEKYRQFIDGGKIPSVLLENKIDLLPKEEQNDTKIKEYSKEKGFDQTFRASVVNNNINIKESMDWIMKEIDRRRAIYKEKIRQEKKLLKESKKRGEKHSMI